MYKIKIIFKRLNIINRHSQRMISNLAINNKLLSDLNSIFNAGVKSVIPKGAVLDNIKINSKKLSFGKDNLLNYNLK